jgi:hypothetical protein
MVDLERELQTRSFFVMDENFLLHRTRALRLLERMKEAGKDWSLYVFSSARVIQSYKIEELVRLGVSWVWMGLEGKNSKYDKLRGVDTHELVRELQSHIIGMEEHTPDNIDAAIEYAVAHDSAFHQFMLYTPLGGTPLFQELKDRGLLVDPECKDAADTHGQLRFAHRHAHIPPGKETEYLLKAFTRDMAVNGPSVIRLARTVMDGYLRYRNHADPCVRSRFEWLARDLRVSYAAMLWAAARQYRDRPAVFSRIQATLRQIYATFGWRARAAAWLLGPFVYRQLRKEEARLKNGWRYEPTTSYERVNEVPQPAAKAAPAGLAMPACGMPSAEPASGS